MISIRETSGIRYESDNREELREYLWRLGSKDPSLWCLAEGETLVGDRKMYYFAPWNLVISDCEPHDNSWSWMQAWSFEDAQKFSRVLNSGHADPQHIGLLAGGAFAARTTPASRAMSFQPLPTGKQSSLPPQRPSQPQPAQYTSTPVTQTIPSEPEPVSQPAVTGSKMLIDADIHYLDEYRKYENGVIYMICSNPNLTVTPNTVEFHNPGYTKLSFTIKANELEQNCWVGNPTTSVYSTNITENSPLLPGEVRNVTVDITGMQDCAIRVGQRSFVNAEVSNIRLHN